MVDLTTKGRLNMNKFFGEMLESLAHLFAQANREALDKAWQGGFEAGYDQRSFEVVMAAMREARREQS